MRKIDKKLLIIIVGLLILSFGFFVCYIIFSQKEEYKENIKKEEKEEYFGDIVFSYIDKSIYIKDAIPTLDKFGIMNEPFTFSIKNKSNETKKYILSLLDDNSTIKNSDIRYELTKNDQVLGINTLSDDGVIDVSEISESSEIKYSIKLWLNYDSEYIVGTFRKKISVTLGSSEEIVNEPILVNGMIPVYYDEDNNSWYKANNRNTYNNEWYDYSKRKWANVVTVDAKKRDFYEKASIGTKILLEDINSFWVWIPRFNYDINNNDIEIKFVNENESAYRSFTFNNEELPGFWIAKFESGVKDDILCFKTSLTKDCNHTNNKLYFAPNYLFTDRITMANLFYTMRKMELNGNIYGFMGAGTKLNNDGTIKNDQNNLDIHMIKNSEWQAVALLSDSKYGKLGNTNYKDDDRLIYHNNSNYTGKSNYQDNLYDYNISIKGTGASTTGNATGIYDMAGGKREYVMINNSKLNIFEKNSNSGFSNKVKDYYYDDDFKEDTTLQFKDRYSSDNNVTNEPITRGAYKNNGNIFNVNSVSDYINKISVESNSRPTLVIVKEKENDKI